MKTITLVAVLLTFALMTCNQFAIPPADPSIRPAYGLLQRLLQHHTTSIVFKKIPAAANKDVYEIKSKKGKIIICGNNTVSMASGLNRYLTDYCNRHIDFNCDRISLPEPLPQVKTKIRVVNRFKYRNFFNYCTFSYTMAWWDWEQWEKIIDYMALKGINMPLAITGQEAVWEEVLLKLGFSPDQIRDFIVGPAYLPWGWMGNIDGLGGPLPQNWIKKRLELQQKIVTRERQLGMTPILQAFTGHVPASLKEIFPEALLHRTTAWAGMPGTWFLDPQDPLDR
ncbi:MAG: alpha-N-acetylglucosaminidase, partial [bacterium]|nr:alpha-N-acetylglucosaminidase [bacterium]